MKRFPLLASLALLGLAACGEAPTDLDPAGPPVADSRTGEVLSGLSPMERVEPMAAPWAEDVRIDAAFASPAPLTLTGDVTLTFDDIPVGADNDDVITDEYAADGVTWVTDDGVVREALSQGDPGNWGLEGTNGPQFLGFNGTSYTGTMVFSDNVSQVMLDASRSNGSQDGDALEIEAFCDGASVDATTVAFGPINDWSTATVAADCIEEVTITGTGAAAFHPYGVDNVVITFEPLDEDGDGLPDEDDLCAGTVVPDPVIPTQDLGRNRFALVDGDDVFDTNRPSPRAPVRVYTLEDTGGCNAGQIADALGLGQGQYRSGLTVGTMERWLRMVEEGAVAP